jgi:hypothetical protein
MEPGPVTAVRRFCHLSRHRDRRVTERPDRTPRGRRRFQCRNFGKQVDDRSDGALDRAALPNDFIAFVVFCVIGAIPWAWAHFALAATQATRLPAICEPNGQPCGRSPIQMKALASGLLAALTEPERTPAEPRA